MSAIAATSINQDEELTLDKKTWAKLREIDIDEPQAYKYLPKDSDTEEEENINEKRFKFHTDGGTDIMAKRDDEVSDDDSISEDERITKNFNYFTDFLPIISTPFELTVSRLASLRKQFISPFPPFSNSFPPPP